MKIEEVTKSKEKLSFKIKDADLSFINAIRRAVVESVPTLAIDIVEFVKNDSVLYDEILAHRLGLLPLKTNIKSFKLREECTCKDKEKGCNNCMVKLKLSVKGREALSTDLKGKGVEIVYEMPLVTLSEDQELELIAEAKLGTGSEHAKFIPGLIWHTYDDEDGKEITINIESWGQMKPEEIFLEAINSFAKNIKKFDKALSKL